MSDYADRFTALIDANVLACAMCRNIILSLAEAGFFRPRWSDRIMDETAGAIAKITKGGANTNTQRSAMERISPKRALLGMLGLKPVCSCRILMTAMFLLQRSQHPLR